MTKIHTATKTKCEHCESAHHDKIKLREHIKTSHENKECMPTQTLNTDIEATQNIDQMETEKKATNDITKNSEALDKFEKVSFEETRIDDTLMEVANYEKKSLESNKTDESIQRIEFRDERKKSKG